jgi:phosphate:Na+ symporter
MDVLYSVLKLVGSIGLFLYGMVKLSDGLQNIAGDRMRGFLATMTSNPLKRILTGTLITSVVQSSSATTVMVVSFVNAGLMTLTQSVGVIMGANIGTTATAWIISLLGFKADIAASAIPIIAIGAPLMMMKSRKKKMTGELLIGFALLFLGLSYMKACVPNIGSSPEILAFLQNYTSGGIFSVLLFVLIGTILTIIIQSSSATVALTLVMCTNGWIPFEMAAAMVLGENIGTTITANLAAMVANVSARRAAMSHTVFNVVGVVWILAIYYPFLNLVTMVCESFGGGNPMTDMAAVAVALSLFHSMFNITNALLLVWFTPRIVTLVTKLIKQKDADEELFRLRHISAGMMTTVALSLHQAKLEAIVFAKRCAKMFLYVREMFDGREPEKFAERFKRIEKYEEISDRIEAEIAGYLIKILENDLSEANAHLTQCLFKVINEMESIADAVYNLARTIKRRNENKIEFDEVMTAEMNELFDLVQKSLDLMSLTLNKDRATPTDIHDAYECEKTINVKRSQLRDRHIANFENGKYSYATVTVFIDLINEAERLGDYIINVSEATFEQ